MMLLKICNNNILFNFNKTFHIDIMAFLIMLFCTIMLVIIVSSKIDRDLFKYFIIIFMCFMGIFFITVFNDYEVHGCYCKYKTVHKETVLKGEKVIIIGDSRMEQIESSSDVLDIPDNMIFIAKGGANIEWFEKEALNELDEDLKKLQYHYNCSVFINMGVNDLNHITDVSDRATEYFSLYKKWALKYPNVKFYIMSVNPIDEDIINYYWKNIRTTKKIENLNKFINDDIKKFNYDHLNYCDSYNNVDFYAFDGLHYSRKTNQRIINYIKNEALLD